MGSQPVKTPPSGQHTDAKLARASQGSTRTEGASLQRDEKRANSINVERNVTSGRLRRYARNLVAAWVLAGRSSSWFASAVLHAAVLLILSALILSQPGRGPLLSITGTAESTVDEAIDFDLSSLDVGGSDDSMPRERSPLVGAVNSDPNRSATSSTTVAAPTLSPTANNAYVAGFDSVENPLASSGGGMQGRNPANRRALALRGGGSEDSEAAVESGLAWLARHQWPDGGWRFDLEQCPNCFGSCRDSGSYRTTTAATGLALLAFLGAGYTHQSGPYQNTVRDGLYYLQQKQMISSKGGDLRDTQTDQAANGLPGNFLRVRTANRDTMYSHGVASLALTEAFAMTRDRELREPAQQAVNFIVNSQYDDGGWRYYPGFETPGELGDTTVTGWQVAALKSALLGGLEVPYDIWMRIMEYLDSVQENGGAVYLYRRGEKETNANTAIGLLCRMVCGWPRDRRPLLQGSTRVAGVHPADNNVYYIYYASQVLHHLGGSNWKRWNPRMRDYLIATQARNGHEAGSWYFQESHSTPGGRLYTTAMAILSLEVYYRYMPLYQEDFVERAP